MKSEPTTFADARTEVFAAFWELCLWFVMLDRAGLFFAIWDGKAAAFPKLSDDACLLANEDDDDNERRFWVDIVSAQTQKSKNYLQELNDVIDDHK